MSKLDGLERALPPEFDEAIYRELHGDLRHMTGAELRSHYQRHGMNEGRRCHELTDRKAFVRRIPADVDALELGPFADPLLTGTHVRYFDVLDKAGLIARAKTVGYDIERIPEIHFVSPEADLGIVAEQSFDVVLSSHVIEHQPDVVGHLRAVERLLRPGGLYFLLVPDKRYCFDHFNPESTIAELIEAHHERRKVHTMRSIIADGALSSHNDPKRHWRGEHGARSSVKERIERALEQYRASDGKYIDVHGWYFTPSAFREALSLLFDLSLTSLQLSRVYPTQRGNHEFWAVLRARSA